MVASWNVPPSGSCKRVVRIRVIFMSERPTYQVRALGDRFRRSSSRLSLGWRPWRTDEQLVTRGSEPSAAVDERAARLLRLHGRHLRAVGSFLKPVAHDRSLVRCAFTGWEGQGRGAAALGGLRGRSVRLLAHALVDVAVGRALCGRGLPSACSCGCRSSRRLEGLARRRSSALPSALGLLLWHSRDQFGRKRRPLARYGDWAW